VKFVDVVCFCLSVHLSAGAFLLFFLMGRVAWIKTIHTYTYILYSSTSLSQRQCGSIMRQQRQCSTASIRRSVCLTLDV